MKKKFRNIKIYTYKDYFDWWYAVPEYYDLHPDADPTMFGHGRSEASAIRHLKYVLVKKERNRSIENV